MSDSKEPVEPYDVCDAKAVNPPQLPGIVEFGGNCDHVLDVVSAELLIEAEQRAHLGEFFQLAVSGGDTLAKFMERMMYNPDMRRFPWDRTHCWLLDDTESGERFDRMRETLVPHSGIDESNLHTASDARGAPEFDFVLMDVGTDGRVGGIHPGKQDGEVQVPLGIINRSNFIALIGLGSRVQAMLTSLADAVECDMPVQQVQSHSGTTKWYLSPTTPEDEMKS